MTSPKTLIAYMTNIITTVVIGPAAEHQFFTIGPALPVCAHEQLIVLHVNVNIEDCK